MCRRAISKKMPRGSELGRQVAVDFESDADFHECGSCPVHSRLPISSQCRSITRPSSRSTLVVTVRRLVHRDSRPHLQSRPRRIPSSRVLEEVIQHASAEYVTVGWLTSTLHRHSFG